MGAINMVNVEQQEQQADSFSEPFDEADLAFWGIGFILICLLCTCYAINTNVRQKRVISLVSGMIVLVGWSRVAYKRMGTMPTDW
jgi:hypothetical protein